VRMAVTCALALVGKERSRPARLLFLSGSVLGASGDTCISRKVLVS